jgi:Ca-activated chloride channel family protein
MIADLCLVLLLDASGSVDAKEWELQAKATAEAISTPAIVEKITHGQYGRIVVTAMEWSSSTVVILPWTQIANMGDAKSVALVLATYQRRQSGSTAVGDALLAAAAAIRAAPDCVRHVVDISSDGTSNAGSDPRAAVLALQAMDVNVNALVIEDEIGVLDFYKRTVSGFVMPATWESYAQAIKAKLTLEIAELGDCRPNTPACGVPSVH